MDFINKYLKEFNDSISDEDRIAFNERMQSLANDFVNEFVKISRSAIFKVEKQQYYVMLRPALPVGFISLLHSAPLSDELKQDLIELMKKHKYSHPNLDTEKTLEFRGEGYNCATLMIELCHPSVIENALKDR